MDLERSSIWIDLDNSPHVPLFAPVIRHYRERGIEVIVTARDHSQTLALLNLAGLETGTAVIGRHHGKSRIKKVRGLLVRSRQLVSYINKVRRAGSRITIAISHGSRSMVLAARWLKIPVLTMYDYEFTETAIFNRLSTRVIVPEGIPDDVLRKIGLPDERTAKYPGIKEELYIRGFVPDLDFRGRLLVTHGLDDAETILVALRPPATNANYHEAASEAVLDAILIRLLATPHVFTVIVPRTSEQAAELLAKIEQRHGTAGRYVILNQAVNGLDLAIASDLLISGGGTMNREAALLGIPVYSIFAGRQGALDAAMERAGTIKFVRSAPDVKNIVLARRDRDSGSAAANRLTDRVERFVIEQIDPFLGRA